MTDPAPNPERQPSPGLQLPRSFQTPVAETFNPTEPEPLAPVHEEEDPQHQHQHQHEPPPQPQQPPPFQPLFTLVTDSTTRATHHPRVHYIFSDDDPDILTEALARQGSYTQNRLASPSGSGTTLEGRDRPRQLSTASTTSPNSERVIVLDLMPSDNTAHSAEHSAATGAPVAAGGGGYEVAWASSLSPDWAVVSAKISPMADDINASSTGAGAGAGATSGAATAATGPGDEDPQQQLILRIEGLGLDAAPPSSAPPQNTATRARGSSMATTTATATAAAAAAAAAAAGGGGRRPSPESRDLRMSGSSGAAAQQDRGEQQHEDYAAVVDEFDRRMAVLRRVLGAGVERQRRLAADEEDIGREELSSAAHEHEHDWGAAAGAGEQRDGEAVPQQIQGRATSSASMRPPDGGE